MTVAVLARAVLNHVSNIPADADNLDFVFKGNQATAADLAGQVDAAGAVQLFFNHTDLAGNGVGTFISPVIDRASSTNKVEYYDITGHLDGSPHGSPIAISNFDVLDPIGGGLPAEVAAVVTLYGSARDTSPVRIPNPAPPPATLRPKQSHTGRIYVGPLTGQAIGDTTGETRLTAAFQTVLMAGAQAVGTQCAAIGTLTEWCVWSRKLAFLDPIVGGHIDNAPDTQRRRGVKSTFKQVFVL